MAERAGEGEVRRARRSRSRRRSPGSPPGHSTPAPSPPQKIPKLESMTSDGELERVLGHTLEAAPRTSESGDDDDRGLRLTLPPPRPDRAARWSAPKLITMNATSRPSRSTALNETVKRVPVELCRRSTPRGVRRACLLPFAGESLPLVVQRLVAACAQDRLAQPLEAEREQQETDDQAQRLDREWAQSGAECWPRGPRATRRGGADADERRAPPADDSDCEHDREAPRPPRPRWRERWRRTGRRELAPSQHVGSPAAALRGKTERLRKFRDRAPRGRLERGQVLSTAASSSSTLKTAATSRSP